MSYADLVSHSIPEKLDDKPIVIPSHKQMLEDLCQYLEVLIGSLDRH
jgi:hypothetical protein